MTRTLLLAGIALTLVACGEKPPTDGAASATAPAETASAPAAPAVTPAAGPCVASGPTVSGASDTAAWGKCVPWNSALPEVKKTGSGMEYVVLGSGPVTGAAPTAAQQAELFYEGRFNAGGGAFDSAYERKESATFPVAQVVPGFSEALQLMKPGDHWLVYIPSALGYGEMGTPGGPIPPNANLVFEIEMVKVH